MSAIGPDRPRVYALDEPPPPRRRPRAMALHEPMSAARWLAVCAATGVLCAGLGWTLARWNGDERPAAHASAPPVAARVLSENVTNLPFGTVPSTAALPLSPSATSPTHAAAPPLPYTVVRAWADGGATSALLDTRGARFTVRGIAVHGDYLVQADPTQVRFTWLRAAATQSVPIPPGAWDDARTRVAAGSNQPMVVDWRSSSGAFAERIRRSVASHRDESHRDED